MPVSFLKNVPLFENLTERDLALLAARCVERRLAAETVVFRQGDPVDGLYVIQKGSVSIHLDAVGQPVQRLASLGPGGFFGEMGLLEKEDRRTATARTTETTLLLHIPRSDLQAILDERPLLAVMLRAAIIRRHGHNVASAVELSGRRETRTRVDAPVRLILDDGTELVTRLENLSPGGACLRGVPPRWQPGRTVRFTLQLPLDATRTGPNPEIAGTLVWRKGDSAGVAFRETPELREQVRRALRILLADS